MTREEALRKLKAWDFLNNDEKEVLETLIPEFQESKNERIRRELIEHFRWNAQILNDFDNREVIAWLEKQGEQKPVLIFPKFRVGDEIKTSNEESLTITKIDEKGYWSEDLFICDFDEECLWDLVEKKPADKVEPEIKVGDWVVSGKYIVRISKIQGQYYIGTDIYGNDITTRSDEVHLWTIENAKDGDVLAAHECLVLFKEIDGLNIKCHCTYHYLNHRTFSIDTLQNKTAFHPATNNQRELLSAEMHMAGYEWNAEKKKLIKIEKQGEQKDINPTLIEKEKMDNAFTKMMLKGKIKWTEEDNDMLDTIESWLDTLCEYLEDSSSECIPNVKVCINWLKSLKQRMEERQQ